MLAEMIGAEEAKSCGFVLDIVEANALQERAAQLVGRLLQNAPLTVRASKEMIRRIAHGEIHDDGADLIAAVYGSEDFRTGVRTFQARTRPTWRGR
jgi:enoyl-CoA hydratase